MENENKIVKVYSNNSKKARIKRNKNKFQRIWDAEKQQYIKVRKAKFAVYPKQEKKEKTVDEQVKAAYAKAKKQKKTKKKSVPVNAVQTEKKNITVSKQKSEKKAVNAAPITTAQRKAITINMFDNALIWDQKDLCYRKAA